MKSFNTLILLWIACSWPDATCAQLEIVTNAGATCVFPGAAKKISVVFYNPDNYSLESQIRTRLFQTSSATTVLLSDKPWKNLQVLAGQTLVESTPFDFPVVNAETKFIVQWLDGTNRVIGQTEVLVYPTNLLEELRPLAGDRPVGLYDPQNQTKPLLQKLQLDFMDLEIADVENFSGRLAVFGPFQSKAQMGGDLAGQIRTLAKKRTAIVWLQPPQEKRGKLLPSFCAVPEKDITVVVVQPKLAANLAEDPQAQLNLIYFCQLALHPQPLARLDSFWNP